MHERQTFDLGQHVFDRAEAAQDALHHLAGCERALALALEPVLAAARDREAEHMVWSVFEATIHFRRMALTEVQALQAAAMRA
ncbi:MAG TPA: hypothetical protein PKD10_05190 [Paracoccaceae bacterium]|nr:hypothetical protein [Paracoccaceae bacterium]HMO70087.1 hypothetical protein [Paracoccaceae bacterium]